MQSKKVDYSQYSKASEMLKAIAHPIRMSIVSILRNKKLTVTEIFQQLQIEQATASHHLRILKHRDVLESLREGKNTFYYLKHKNLSKIIDCIESCCPSEN
jgi:DNA-binding transcriptional ArsR family regulator